jgi:hypothetical protein
MIAAGSFSLFSTHLASQDTSLRGYLSGMMLGFTASPGDNQLIRVNLHNKSIALYENGQLYQLAKVAGAGNPNDATATPIGEFRILSKEKMHKSRLSGVLMPLAMRFHEGYYFHDIPLTPGGAKITTRYSHGCIRLPSDLVQGIYDWTKVGAYVQVYRAYLVKDDTGPMVYKLTEDGYRQPIATESAFISRGFRWEDIAVVPAPEIAGLPLGPTLY